MRNDKKGSYRRKSNILRYLDELNYSLEPFYHMDFERLRNIRKIVSNLERALSEYQPQRRLSVEVADAKRMELVGLLPIMLMSREMFPTHKSLYDFSKSVLGVELRDRLSRPARTRIVGEILKEVMQVTQLDRDRVLDKLQEVIKSRMDSVERSFFIDWDSTIRKMRHGNTDSEA